MAANDAKVESDELEGAKNALASAIAEAAEKKEADYTAESWKMFADAHTAAREVLKNNASTSSEMKQAAASLEQAMDSLVLTPEAALKEALEKGRRE